MYPLSDNELPVAVPARFVCANTVVEPLHPAMKDETDEPVWTRPILKVLFRPESARVVHEDDATTFTEKLPEEN